MKKRSGFSDLKEDFKTFKIKNKTNISKSVPLFDGEEVLIPPHAEVSIDSSNVMQMPDTSFFKLISPSIDDLIKYDLIKVAEEEKKKPAENK